MPIPDQEFYAIRDACELLRSAFLRFLQKDNECYAGVTGKACHAEKCACAMELQNYLDVERDLNQQKQD